MKIDASEGKGELHFHLVIRDAVLIRKTLKGGNFSQTGGWGAPLFPNLFFNLLPKIVKLFVKTKSAK